MPEHKPCTVLPSSRQIFERKVLMAVDDPELVVTILGRDALDIQILALTHYAASASPGMGGNKTAELAADMEQLRREAFGEAFPAHICDGEHPRSGSAACDDDYTPGRPCSVCGKKEGPF